MAIIGGSVIPTGSVMTPFVDVPTGNVFEHEEEHYRKIVGGTGEPAAINVRNNRLRYFAPHDAVYELSAEFVPLSELEFGDTFVMDGEPHIVVHCGGENWVIGLTTGSILLQGDYGKYRMVDKRDLVVGLL
jgi:hypothetical protein